MERSVVIISSWSGNRSSSCFEKIIVPLAMTSKIPFVPSTNSDSMPSSLLIAAARLEAFGKYFQRVQYVIDNVIRTPNSPILSQQRFNGSFKNLITCDLSIFTGVGTTMEHTRLCIDHDGLIPSHTTTTLPFNMVSKTT